MTVVNSWLLYERDAQHLGIPKSKQSGLVDFKLKIDFSRMKSRKDVNRKRGKPSSASVDLQYKRKKNTGNATKPIPQLDIRLDRVAHFSTFCRQKGNMQAPQMQWQNLHLLH